MDYIKQSTENRQSREQTSKVLLESGWNEADVEEAFQKIRQTQSVLKEESLVLDKVEVEVGSYHEAIRQKSNKKLFSIIAVSVGIFLLIAGSVAVYFVFIKQDDKDSIQSKSGLIEEDALVLSNEQDEEEISNVEIGNKKEESIPKISENITTERRINENNSTVSIDGYSEEIKNTEVDFKNLFPEQYLSFYLDVESEDISECLDVGCSRYFEFEYRENTGDRVFGGFVTQDADLERLKKMILRPDYSSKEIKLSKNITGEEASDKNNNWIIFITGRLQLFIGCRYVDCRLDTLDFANYIIR